MKPKNAENIDEIAVIDIDIAKDTFHPVGVDHGGQRDPHRIGAEFARSFQSDSQSPLLQ